jgi:hypothetical protein
VRNFVHRLVVAPMLIAAFLVPVPTASASARAPDLALRSGRSSWIGRDLVDDSGGPQQNLRAPIQPSRTREVLIELRNDGPQAMFVLTGSAGTSEFTVSYLDGHHHDVTDEWTGSGERVRVSAGQRVFFHLRVTAAGDLDTGANMSLWVRAQGVRSGVADLVKAQIKVGPHTVAATTGDRRLRCSASFPSRSIRVGSLIGATVRMKNISHHDVQTDAGSAYLVVRSSDGRFLWNTGSIGFFSQPPAIQRTLAPRRSLRLYLWDAKVRWPGPLQVRVICGGLDVHMPFVSLDVISPGAPVSVAAAIDAAVGVQGSPFQQCHPGPNGEPVIGTIATPDGRDVPPLTVRCWASVKVEPGFDAVKLHLVSPDDAPSYVLNDRFRIRPQPDRDAPNFLAASWSFVVTSDYVRSYLALEELKAYGSGPGVYGYFLRHGRWSSSDWSICGSEGFVIAFLGTAFPLEFITGCEGASRSPETRTWRRTLVLGGQVGKALSAHRIVGNRGPG